MSKKPVLIMQMQRMGDLILTYPLMLWLQRKYPDHPLFVAAAEQFYKPLMRFSPSASYFPISDVERLLGTSYKAVVNLSITDAAARLTHHSDADLRFGPRQKPDASRVVGGAWQIYRTALVQNNKYNRYHWADLNALDIIPLKQIRETRFSLPRTLGPEVTKVGLFLGASEEAKRPTSRFWADLIHHLLGRGLRPVLFGGPDETALGDEVMRLADAPALNLCGKLSLEELGTIGQTLALFITPDTGPMHLAAWTGLKCLNLSMGNVNPWETGPYQPGHYVLRADMECAKGCWHCTRDRLYCHDPFDPKRVAALTGRLVAGDGPAKLARLGLPGLTLYETGRNDLGLYHLKRLDSTPPDEERLVSRFWYRYFAEERQYVGAEVVRKAWQDMLAGAPEAARTLVEYFPTLSRQFATGVQRGGFDADSFWGGSPAVIRPFTGHAQMVLSNGNFDRKTWAIMLTHLERLIGFCR